MDYYCFTSSLLSGNKPAFGHEWVLGGGGETPINHTAGKFYRRKRNTLRHFDGQSWVSVPKTDPVASFTYARPVWNHADMPNHTFSFPPLPWILLKIPRHVRKRDFSLPSLLPLFPLDPMMSLATVEPKGLRSCEIPKGLVRAWSTNETPWHDHYYFYKLIITHNIDLQDSLQQKGKNW